MTLQGVHYFYIKSPQVLVLESYKTLAGKIIILDGHEGSETNKRKRRQSNTHQSFQKPNKPVHS